MKNGAIIKPNMESITRNHRKKGPESSMKRSQINKHIKEAEIFFETMHFRLPPWAFWTLDQWRERQEACDQIIENLLGWDLTDFGGGDFDNKGLLLFTLRNGGSPRDQKPYAEKIMLVRENQVTPLHFHYLKVEDIINRGGGNLILRLFGSTEDEKLSELPLAVEIDGILHKVEPGEEIRLRPGQSIFFEQRVYHDFYAEKSKGSVLVGEVSSINDDLDDNRFYEEMGRFPEIIEDQSPYRLLVTDYGAMLKTDTSM
jgi:D-lyxose ketol-isomerase